MEDDTEVLGTDGVQYHYIHTMEQYFIMPEQPQGWTRCSEWTNTVTSGEKTDQSILTHRLACRRGTEPSPCFLYPTEDCSCLCSKHSRQCGNVQSQTERVLF